MIYQLNLFLDEGGILLVGHIVGRLVTHEGNSEQHVYLHRLVLGRIFSKKES